MRLSILASVVLSLSSVASAQRVIAHDTLGGAGSAVTCGFCAGEKFGVVFRELPPPARGLEAGDFPIELRGVRVAVANAFVSGGVCAGDLAGGAGLADLEIYAGTTAPSGSIRDNPVDAPWDGEELVWAGVDIPLSRSALEGEGSTTFSVSFNDLQIRGDMDEILRIEAPNTYVRVVFTFQEEADRNPSGCEDSGLVSPTSFPMRDDDGRIAPERSFIWGEAGLGWQWNEAVRVGGDWAVRLEIRALGTPGVDAGPPDAGSDAGDAGTIDAGRDAGTSDATTDAGGGTSGGGCGVARGQSDWGFALLGLWALRRRRS